MGSLIVKVHLHFNVKGLPFLLLKRNEKEKQEGNGQRHVT